jgi:ankyrin repeat protein
MDIVELLLKKGADIFATPSFNSPLVIYEYFEYGTTKVLSWFLDEYLSLKDVPAFIERVLNADILQESVVELFKVRVKRHPAHAILACGNQDIMEKFLGRYPSQDLLDVEDPNGKTALQVAAEQNNLASVKILLKL